MAAGGPLKHTTKGTKNTRDAKDVKGLAREPFLDVFASIFLCDPSCPLWLKAFLQDGGEESIAGMHAGQRAQEGPVRNRIQVLPDKFLALAHGLPLPSA